MIKTMKLSTLLNLAIFILLVDKSTAWGSSDKVILKDVEVLTLYSGRMTAGRRSSAVPQLKCGGGNAGCHSFVPQVVQCYNRGSDGIDVQWECKTDMDNAFRFGNVQVSCEGYEYPEDPYILKGSCGLEYTLDLTKEGMHNQGEGSHNYYEGNSYQQSAHTGNYKSGPKSSYIGNLLCGAVICIIVYGIYKTCIAPVDETRQRSSTNQDYPDHRGPGSSPPPPGFRRNYYPDNDGFSGGSDSCSGNARSSGAGGLGGNAGGFWTGAATGGLLGYMFGSRNNAGGYGYNAGYSQAFPGTSRRSYGGNSFGGGGGFSSFGGGSSGASSSGTRTSSGFGGTSRR